MTGPSWRHIDYLLKQWGRFVWLYGESVGCYPRQSSSVGRVERAPPFSWFRVRQLTAKVKGKGDRAVGAHKILCEKVVLMPDFLREVEIAVNALPEAQYMAVICKYATGLDAHGQEWPNRMMAWVLEISEIAFEERLRAARKRIARTLAKTTGMRVHSRHCPSLSPKPA